jgi:hypothetical protein
MTETVEDIQKVHRARIERAQRFEALTGQQLQLRATIARLETPSPSVEALKKIHALSGDISPDLLTGGVSSLAFSVGRGLIVRSVLMQVAGAALQLAERKDAERNEELTKARITLAAVETELAGY